MITRVEKTEFATVDGVKVEAVVAYCYGEYTYSEGGTHKELDIVAGLCGAEPIESWDSKNDLPVDFLEEQQKDLRAAVEAFVLQKTYGEILDSSEPRLVGLKLRLREEDVG